LRVCGGGHGQADAVTRAVAAEEAAEAAKAEARGGAQVRLPWGVPHSAAFTCACIVRVFPMVGAHRATLFRRL
jgi:hypothetical protein